MNDAEKLRGIRALYEKLPKIHCAGLCVESCGPIGMSRIEFNEVKRVSGRNCGQEMAGVFLLDFDRKTGACPLLKDGLCGAYEARPAVCRLFGASRKMPCPFGCVPERWLTEAEEQFLFSEILRIGQ